MPNLIEGIQRQQKRCRILAENYADLGKPGQIPKALVDAAVDEADTAIASGDIIKMLVAYKKLEAIE